MALSSIILSAEYFDWLWQGAQITLGLSALAIIAATLLGAVLAFLRQTQALLLKLFVVSYCAFFRNTPLLVQLFFWYFAVGKFLPHSWLPWLNAHHAFTLSGIAFVWPSFEFLSGLFGLTLYFAAFISEEIRSGIQGIAKGQKQASLALGLTQWQTMRFVILPQAFKLALSPLLGQYMNIIKSTSLTMAIGVTELSYAARQVETASLKAFQAFAIATLFYILIIACIEAFGIWAEHKQQMRARH